jgi:WD40 repeat protein
LIGHFAPIHDIKFSYDSSQILTISEGKTCRLWDCHTGEELHELNHNDVVNSADYSDDGSLILTSSDDNIVRLWDSKNGTLVNEFDGCEGTVLGAKFINSNGDIATISDDNFLIIWSVTSGKWTHKNKINTGIVCFDSNDKQICIGSKTGSICLFDIV